MLQAHVVITGLMATDNPYPGLGIARCLREAPEFHGRISGFVFDPLSTGAFCKGVFERVFSSPIPRPAWRFFWSALVKSIARILLTS